MTTCPLCTTDLADAVLVCTEGRHKPVDTVVCQMCALVQQRPRPTAEEVARYYASGEYYASRADTVMVTGDGRVIGQDSPEWDGHRDMRHMRQAQDVVKGLALQPGERVIEVGGGDGSVAQVVSQMAGVTVDVVEADADMRAIAHGRGLTAVAGVSDPIVASYRYDAAYTLHVVEHHADPVAELAALRAVCKPAARLIVAVPDLLAAHGDMATWLDEAHLQHFTRETLVATCKRAGWDTVAVAKHAGEVVAKCTAGTPSNAVRVQEDPAEIVAFCQRWAEASARDHANGVAIRTLLDAEQDETLPEELRAALRHLRGMAGRQAVAYQGAKNGLAALVRTLEEAMGVECASDDEALRYASVVRGAAYASCAQAAGHLLNWCAMREAEG